MPAGSVDDVRSRLESIGEELADLALDRLREAISAGEKTSAAERLITRARRSVEKAAVLLGQIDVGQNDVGQIDGTDEAGE